MAYGYNRFFLVACAAFLSACNGALKLQEPLAIDAAPDSIPASFSADPAATAVQPDRGWPRVKVYYVNVDSSVIRSECIRSQLEPISLEATSKGAVLHFERYSAVTFTSCKDPASCLVERPECFPTGKVGYIHHGRDGKPEEKARMIRGVLGNWCSHLIMLRKLLQETSNYDYFLVIEDDVIFRAGFIDSLLALLKEFPHNWHLVTMDTFSNRHFPEHDTWTGNASRGLPLYALSETKNTYWGAHAWLMSSFTLKGFARWFERTPGIPLDWLTKVPHPPHVGLWAYQPSTLMQRQHVSEEEVNHLPSACRTVNGSDIIGSGEHDHVVPPVNFLTKTHPSKLARSGVVVREADAKDDVPKAALLQVPQKSVWPQEFPVDEEEPQDVQLRQEQLAALRQTQQQHNKALSQDDKVYDAHRTNTQPNEESSQEEQLKIDQVAKEKPKDRQWQAEQPQEEQAREEFAVEDEHQEIKRHEDGQPLGLGSPAAMRTPKAGGGNQEGAEPHSPSQDEHQEIQGHENGQSLGLGSSAAVRTPKAGGGNQDAAEPRSPSQEHQQLVHIPSSVAHAEGLFSSLPAKPVREVVILGMPNSGTRLLQNMLRQHIEQPRGVQLCRANGDDTTEAFCGRIWHHTHPSRLAEAAEFRQGCGDQCESLGPLSEAVGLLVVRHPIRNVRKLQEERFRFLACTNQTGVAGMASTCLYEEQPSGDSCAADGRNCTYPRVPRALCEAGQQAKAGAAEFCWESFPDAWNSYTAGFQQLQADRVFNKVLFLRYEDLAEDPTMVIHRVSHAVGLKPTINEQFMALRKIGGNAMVSFQHEAALARLNTLDYGAKLSCAEIQALCARLDRGLFFSLGYHACQKAWPAYDELIFRGSTYETFPRLVVEMDDWPERHRCAYEWSTPFKAPSI